MNTAYIVTLALSLAALPAPAIELHGGKLALSEGESELMSKCDAEGGCHIVTVALLKRLFGHMYDGGLAEGKKGCGIRTL